MAPRKANQPKLTREQIIEAAIRIVDRDGLEGLSMRGLANELGMSPMSLYYHVADKSALYDLILDALMNAIDLGVDDASKSPEERLVAAGYELRRVLLAHPRAVPIATSRSPRTKAQLRPVEVLVGILFDAGLAPTDAWAAVDIVAQYVFGTASACANQIMDNEFRSEVGPDFSALTPDEFPNMTRLFSEGRYLGQDAEFDRGLRVLAHGLLAGEER